MSTLSISELAETNNLVSGILAAQFAIPATSLDLSLQIEIPDFHSEFRLPLVEISTRWQQGRVILITAVDKGSRLAFVFSGEFASNREPFKIKQVSLGLDKVCRVARSEFMLVSMWAVFGLAERVQLRMVEQRLDLGLRFTAPLLEISEMLRRRQIAYRVMVIERATGIQLDLPVEISGAEVEEIALIYHAITEGSFDWPIDEITVFFPATAEWRDRVRLAADLTSFTLGPDPFRRTLFSKEVDLGEGMVTLFDKRIENLEKVDQELSTDDGHEVAVVIRSMSGHGRYQFPKAPRLPADPWPANVQELVNLELRLDSKLVERYNDLAASTFAGLSDEEKSEITARSSIGAAFVIDPPNPRIL